MQSQESKIIELDFKRDLLWTDTGIVIEYHLWITNLGNSECRRVKGVVNGKDLELPADILEEGAEISVLLCRTGGVAIDQGLGSSPPYNCEIFWIDVFGQEQSTSEVWASPS